LKKKYKLLKRKKKLPCEAPSFKRNIRERGPLGKELTKRSLGAIINLSPFIHKELLRWLKLEM